MKKLLLKKIDLDGKEALSIVEPADGDAAYALVRQKESLLKDMFIVRSKLGEEVATIKMEHILFTPAKLPVFTISTKNGERFIVKKEIEQLSDVINIEGEGLAIKGNPSSERFELLCSGRCIAAFIYNDEGKQIFVEDGNYEFLAVAFAFALKLAN